MEEVNPIPMKKWEFEQRDLSKLLPFFGKLNYQDWDANIKIHLFSIEHHFFLIFYRPRLTVSFSDFFQAIIPYCWWIWESKKIGKSRLKQTTLPYSIFLKKKSYRRRSTTNNINLKDRPCLNKKFQANTLCIQKRMHADKMVRLFNDKNWWKWNYNWPDCFLRLLQHKH